MYTQQYTKKYHLKQNKRFTIEKSKLPIYQKNISNTPLNTAEQKQYYTLINNRAGNKSPTL